jgi:hypothetical protein
MVIFPSLLLLRKNSLPQRFDSSEKRVRLVGTSSCTMAHIICTMRADGGASTNQSAGPSSRCLLLVIFLTVCTHIAMLLTQRVGTLGKLESLHEKARLLFEPRSKSVFGLAARLRPKVRLQRDESLVSQK